MCIGINVLWRFVNAWYILQNVCQCNNISNNLWGNKKTKKNFFFDCVNLLSIQGQCRAQFGLLFLKIYQISSRPVTLALTNFVCLRAYTFVNNPSYKSRGPTTNQSVEAINAKSKKYRGVFNVKSRKKTRQVREKLSKQLDYKQVPKKKERTKPGVRKGRLYSARLEASSGPRTEGNQKRWRSGPSLLWGGLDKSRHIVPSALLVRM